MRRMLSLQLGGFILLILHLAVTGASGQVDGSRASISLRARGVASGAMTDATIRFRENRGQVIDSRGRHRPDILYTVGAGRSRLFLLHDALSYVFTRWVPDTARQRSDEDPLVLERKRIGARDMSLPTGHLDMDRVDMQLIGANPNAVVVAEDRTGDYANYYYSHCPDGITDVPSYRRLIYRDIYPHIDLVLYSHDNHMKYDFVVHPGGHPADIAWRYAGADGAGIATGGAIEARGSLGSVTDGAPYAYQGKGRGVGCRYSNAGDVFGFDVRSYDANADLVIDPTVMWATYVAGTADDLLSGGAGITVDVYGDIAATGATYSVDFPVTPGAIQNTNSGGQDLFVIKLRSMGALVWSTYMGGPNNEAGRAVAVDSVGRYAFVGVAADDFPTANAFQGVCAGSVDVVVGYLDSTGKRRWVTYFGGAQAELPEDVTIDPSGDIIMVGETSSSNFPLINPWRGTIAGQDDGFIVKLRPSGLLVWSSMYGGSNIDEFTGVATYSDRTIAVSGFTDSPNFPMFGTPFQASRSGLRVDACVLKVGPTGIPQWSTYFGGYTVVTGRTIGVDPNNGAVILGGISSAERGGPPAPVPFDITTTPSAFQSAYQGRGDGFIARFTRNGTYQWATYYASGDTDFVKAIIITPSGDIMFTGGTRGGSSPNHFPVTPDAYLSSTGSAPDAYLVQLDSNGVRKWATLYGSVGAEYGYDIAFGVASVYVVGLHSGGTLPGTTNGFMPASPSGDIDYDGFIVRFNGFCPIPAPKVKVSGPLVFCEGDSVVLTAAPGYEKYQWSNAVTTQSAAIKSSGTYWVTVTDGATCTAASSTIKVLVHKKPIAAISPAGTIGMCQSDSIRLDAFHDDIVKYKWSNGDSLARIWVKTAGTYTVNVVDTAGCTNTSLAVVVKVTSRPKKPVIAASDTVWLCPDSVFYFYAGAGYTNYRWYPSRRAGDRLLVDSSGLYSVEVNDIPGCSIVSDSVMVLFYPRVPVHLPVTGTHYICQGDSLVLTIPAGSFTAPVWSNGAFTPRIAAKTNGVYYVTVTDSNGCRVRSDSVRVIVRPTPKADITGPVSICGNSHPIYSTRTVGTLTYEWSLTGDGTIQGPANTRAITVAWGSAGSGKLTLRVTDTVTGCGDVGSRDIVIGTSLKPVVTPSGTITICSGDSVELDAGSGYSTYAWSNGATSQTIWVKDNQGYAVTVVDASGCSGTSDTVHAQVDVPPPPVVDGPVRVCRNTTVSYTVRDVSGTDYQWQITGGTLASGQGTPAATVQWGAGPAGTVSVTMTSAGGCKSTSQVTVDVGTILKPAITPGGSLTLCPGDSIELDAGGGYSSYAWSSGETSQKIMIKTAGNYTVTVGDPSGCGGTSDPVVVQLGTAPVVTVVPSGAIRLNPGDSVILDAGPGFNAYRWTVGGIPQGISRTFVAHDSGSYAVRVTDANGCTGTAQVHIDLNSARVELALGNIQGTPGEHVLLPIEMTTSQDLAASGASTYEARIRYHASLLVPTGTTPAGMMDGTDRVVTVTGALPAGMTSGTLSKLEFIAALGDVTTGTVKLESVSWKGTSGDARVVANTLHDGSFTTTGICTNGGARLVLANGTEGLKTVIPNPSSGTVRIAYDLVERGQTRLTITDLVGREVGVVYSGNRIEGAYEDIFDATKLSTGVYVIVLETPTARMSTMMQVVR